MLFFILGKIKIKIPKKIYEKTPADIIILHKCTKNHDHILYTVPEIWCVTDVIAIFHFGLFFALLPPCPSNSPRNENFKKNEKKNPGDIIILHKCTKNHNHMSYTAPETWCVMVVIFHFGLFFALLPP